MDEDAENISILPPDVEYEEEEEEKPEEPAVLDDLDNKCRGDEQVRCGTTSTYICEVQKCDGVSNCPNGEDEENCPNESPIVDEEETSGDEEIPIEQSSSVEPEHSIPGDFSFDFIISKIFFYDFQFGFLLFSVSCRFFIANLNFKLLIPQ